MSRIDVLEFKKYFPARALTALKPYYRRFFPNQVIALINPTWRCNYRFSCDRDSVLIRPVQIKSASEKPVARVQGTGQVR